MVINNTVKLTLAKYEVLLQNSILPRVCTSKSLPELPVTAQTDFGENPSH